jgi:hypothetical protein
MQADYTRKTQEVAELRKSIEGERRAVLDEREKFLSRWEEAQRERAPRPVEEPASNPLERIRQLREEGRHEEADALLMAAAEETVAPIKAKAEVQERQATFRNIIAETRNADPIVANYFKDVAAIWDAPDPAVTIVRNALLSSPENMKYIPTILNIVARAVHAEKIEAELETRIKKERKSAVESEKARAAGIPSSLIESGGRSRDGAAPKLSIREAARLALRSSLGASDA